MKVDLCPKQLNTTYHKLVCFILLMVFFFCTLFYNFTGSVYIEDSTIDEAATYGRLFLNTSDSGNKSLYSKSAGRNSPRGKMMEVQQFQLQEEEYRERITTYQDVCAVRKSSVESSDNVFYYKNPSTSRSLSFCAVPKAGSTFWARIFQFLNSTSDSLSSPLDITRFQVYYKPPANLQQSLYNQDNMAHAERFFFVRDPYARLLSAYVDKFLLPQFLTWGIYGNVFAKHRSWNAQVYQPCVTKVTFTEFIETLVLSGDDNVHWKPVHRVCDPCKLFPHVIGKQETFSKDVKYILSKVGLQHLMTKYSYKTYVDDEIRQMVDFTYSFRDVDRYLRKCVDNIEIASRIWVAFQMNGYLASHVMFPNAKMEKLLKNVKSTLRAKNIVTDIILEENIRVSMSRDRHTKQKRAMMLQQFRTLSSGTMEKLADMYDVDFKMFGYEKYPEDLFPWKFAQH